MTERIQGESQREQSIAEIRSEAGARDHGRRHIESPSFKFTVLAVTAVISLLLIALVVLACAGGDDHKTEALLVCSHLLTACVSAFLGGLFGHSWQIQSSPQ